LTLYLDSSALVKLVISEPETRALRAFLRQRAERSTTCALARTEVVRAVAPHGDDAVATAREVFGALFEIPLSRHVLDRGGVLAHELTLRSLDAIHLSAAEEIRPHITTIVTYDRRMADAARQRAFDVAAPT
jgi:predicted nucleic acid-binding protein